MSDVERLGAEDAASIIALFRRALPAERLPDTIYRARGVARWLEELMHAAAVAGPHAPVVHLGIRSRTGLVACSESREVQGAWHLNQICTAPELQSAGLGASLLEAFVAQGVERGLHKLSLDVDGRSTAARDWYLRRGFATTRVSHVLYRQLGHHETERGPKAFCTNWPLAQAAHDAYGFCELTFSLRGRAYGVGRLSDERFRVSETIPPEVERAMCALGMCGTVVEMTLQPVPPGLCVYPIHRMERDLDP